MQIDEAMEICTHVYPEPLKQFFQTHHDYVLEAPGDRKDQQLYYYKGQLETSLYGAKNCNCIDIANTIIDRCFSITYFKKSIYNVDLLRKHFKDIIYRFCSSYWVRQIMIKHPNKEERDDLIYQGIYYYIVHVRYNPECQLLQDCCPIKDTIYFAEELERLIKNVFDEIEDTNIEND